MRFSEKLLIGLGTADTGNRDRAVSEKGNLELLELQSPCFTINHRSQEAGETAFNCICPSLQSYL